MGLFFQNSRKIDTSLQLLHAVSPVFHWFFTAYPLVSVESVITPYLSGVFLVLCKIKLSSAQNCNIWLQVVSYYTLVIFGISCHVFFGVIFLYFFFLIFWSFYIHFLVIFYFPWIILGSIFLAQIFKRGLLFLVCVFWW